MICPSETVDAAGAGSIGIAVTGSASKARVAMANRSFLIFTSVVCPATLHMRRRTLEDLLNPTSSFSLDGYLLSPRPPGGLRRADVGVGDKPSSSTARNDAA